jgi:hypothetical protein
VHRLLWSAVCVLILAIATGCSVMSTGSTPAISTPTMTIYAPPTATVAPAPPTPTDVPAGWQFFSGQHFVITYPPAWTTSLLPSQTGLSGGGVILTNPATGPAASQVSVVEEWGYSSSQLQAICQLQGTTVNLAGLPMNYTVGEGVHRSWLFVDNQGVTFSLDALDAARPSQVQQLDNSILATFQLDDSTSGCPAT